MKPNFPEPIPMNRRRYKGVRSRVNTVAAVLAVPFFGMGGLGFYLEEARGVTHASMVCGILAVLICGFVGICWQRSIMNRLPCPLCGRVPLRPKEDERKMQLLICDSCAIEWDTGVCNDHG